MPTPLKQILELLGHPERAALGWLMLALLIGVVLETAGIGLILPLMRLMVSPEDVHRFAILERAYRFSGVQTEQAFLVLAFGAVAAVFVLKNLVIGWSAWYQSKVIQGIRTNFSSKLFDIYIRADYSFHLNNNSNILIRNLSQSTAIVFNNVLMSYIQIGSELLVMGCILLALAFVTPGIAIVIFAGAALVFGAFNLRFRHISHNYGQWRSNRLYEQLKVMEESFGAAKDIAVLNRQAHFSQRYHAVDKAVGQINTGVYLLNSLPRLIVESLGICTLMGAAIAVMLGGSSNAEVVTFLGVAAAAAVRLMPSLSRIIQGTNNIQTGCRFLDDIHRDYLNARTRPAAERRGRPFHHSIALRHVNFGYGDGETPVIHDLSLAVCKGESLALVGPSGGGKSTVVDIMLGLLHPQSGTVEIDGAPLGRDEFPEPVGYVPQRIPILDDTLRNNVAFGIEADKISDARIIKALTMAQLDDLLSALPEGLDTRLGEKGARLSGGQRQRVGIARALYHQPELLVLDEATAALDVETEARLSETIQALSGSKTLVIIAHRLSTVQKCHRIALLEKGRLTGLDTFDTLYQRNERFRELVRLAELRPTHELP